MASKHLAGRVATVFNGNGFIANNIISRLGKHGCNLVIAHRGSGYSEFKSRTVGGLGQVNFAHYHLKDEPSLYDAMQHSDIVVNCVGKFNETKNFSFEEVHVEGPRRMARIARECGVKKFIHFSCLQASPNPEAVVMWKPSKFFKSKYYGELAVREEFPEAVIFRPGAVIGSRDDFIVHFTTFIRSFYSSRLPIWDYYHEVQKRPLLVTDMATAVLKAIDSDWANGKIIQATGPYSYDMYELIEYIRSCSGQGQKYDQYQISNLRYHIPLRILMFVANKLQKYPFLCWDRIEWDSHSDILDPKLPTLEDLGVQTTPVEKEIQRLGSYRPRFHRFEIPYDSREIIDLPRRLNADEPKQRGQYQHAMA